MVSAVPNPQQQETEEKVGPKSRKRHPHLMEKAWNRLRTVPGPASPYKIGDAVVGDDPFNGRRDGVVISRARGFVSIDTEQGVFHYDPRHVRRQD